MITIQKTINMKKKIMMLSCIAACAIVSGYVGMKAYESHAYESNSLLMQNVEALTQDGGDNGGNGHKGCKTESTAVFAQDKCVHGYYIGFRGIKYTCSEGTDTICKEGKEGAYTTCQGKRDHPGEHLAASKNKCK